MTRLLRLLVGVMCLSMLLVVGCDGGGGGGGGDGTADTSDSGVPCGPYLVDTEGGLDTYIVIRGLWSDGSDYREILVRGSYVPLPGQSRPTGWTSTVSSSSGGVDLGTHTLQFSGVNYNPISFTLTIDGTFTCNYP